jgi:hypothetical protein
MQTQRYNKIISLLLTVVLLLGITPYAFAANEETQAAEAAAALLTEMYGRCGAAEPLAAVGLRSLTDSEELRGIPFALDYSVYYAGLTNVYYGSTHGVVALDEMAMGHNPRAYEKNITGTSVTERFDLIEALLNALQSDGTFNVSMDKSATALTMNGAASKELWALLALEAYYGGADWQNANGVTRVTAITKFLSYFQDATAASWGVSGGRYCASVPVPALTLLSNQTRLQLAVPHLLVRWLNDDTVIGEKTLGEIAQTELDGMLTTLKAFFNKNITVNSGSATMLYNNIHSTQNVANLISVLVAVGEKELADTWKPAGGDKTLLEILLLAQWDYESASDAYKLQAETQGSGYVADAILHKGAFTISAGKEGYLLSSTNAAALALGDYLRGASMLATLTFDAVLGDADAVAWDLSSISVPDVISGTGDISLPTRGVYGSDISWESSNNAVINASTGAVTLPPQGQNYTVKLTATVSHGEVHASQDFIVTVMAQLSADAQAVSLDAAELALTLPLFTYGDGISLPENGGNGSSITWTSSDDSIVSASGQVTRLPDDEQRVLLTASLMKGEINAEKTFEILVGKSNIENDAVTMAVYKARAYLDAHRNITSSNYWQTWAAKAIFGDDYYKYNFPKYNVKTHRLSSSWKGTDYGAVILQILSQGDNPYSYQGVDYVKDMKAYAQSGWGGFAEPIFLTMALDAAGEMTPELFSTVVGRLGGMTGSYSYGPDMGGWSLVPLSARVNNVQYGTSITTPVNNFRTKLLSSLVTEAADVNYGLAVVNPDLTGYSNTVSNACVVIGAVAMAKAGLSAWDITAADWEVTDGFGIADAIYKAAFKDFEGPYNYQAVIAMGDLFYGENVWTKDNATPQKLKALLDTVKPIIEDGGADYTAKTFEELSSAYTAADAKKDSEYGYGKEYFTLRDALKNLKPAGSISVRVLGETETLYDTSFISATGSVFDILSAYAVENGVSQTTAADAVQEIGGLTGNWRVYNGEARVTDLTAPLGEGAELTFKLTANPSSIPADAPLDRHLAIEAAESITLPSEVTDNVTLPGIGAFGTSIVWLSGNPLYLGNDGRVTRIAEDVRVRVTATVSGPNGSVAAKAFDVIIKGTGGGDGGAITKSASISVIDSNAPTGQKRVYFELRSLSIEPGETAFTLLLKTGLDVRYSSHTEYGAYVEAIDGYGEFDGGATSGWVCKVNGSGITKSSALIPIGDGDVVEWLYTRELGADVGIPWLGEGSNNPGNDSGSDNTNTDGGADAVPPVATETIEAKTTINTDTGKATAEVTTATMTKAVTDAKKAVAEAKASGDATAKAEVKIIAKAEPATPGAAATPVKSVEVDIPAEAFKAVAESKELVLTVESDVSTLTLDTATLTAIAETAKAGETIKIAAEAVDNAEALNEKQQAKVGDNPVIEVNITVGTTAITNLGGTVTVSVPYTPPETVAETDQDLLTVYYLDDDGNITEMKGAKYDAATGKITFATTHFSKFLISEWINPFNDIAKGEWFYKAARYAYSNALITGVTDTTFAPQSTLTRAMLATILYRNTVGGGVHTAPPSSETPFTDVVSNQWYTDAIAWASSNGLITGVGDNKFDPNDPITREQFATLLYRYTQWTSAGDGRPRAVAPTDANLSAYTDADTISDWAQEAMAWAVSTGLITGRTETTLAPEIPANRAEAAMLLQRCLETIA